MRKVFAATVVAVCVFVPTIAAQAESYPTKPITLTIGFPPGGPSDTAARILGERFMIL
jgi:tripartite-type tricarboxylate transporter receptor subunit TctC